MKQKDILTIGIVIILCGILLLLANIGILEIEMFWPLIPLAIGGALICAFTKGRKESSLLMAGTMLTIPSILFQYCIITSWESMNRLWPFLILAVGCGFLGEYFMVQRSQTRLSLGMVLVVTAILLLLMNHLLGRFWPVILILLGIFITAFSSIRDLSLNKQRKQGEQESEKTTSQKDTQEQR